MLLCLVLIIITNLYSEILNLKYIATHQEKITHKNNI